MSLTLSERPNWALILRYNPYGQAFWVGLPIIHRVMKMAGEKATRELVYEMNRDVKWICRALRRTEARDEELERRLRALEGWRAEKAGEERRVSMLGARGPAGLSAGW